MKTPTISVLMPVYNTGSYLADAIESILNQTFGDFEFIIINDGSTDNSKEIVLSYNDDRIVFVDNEQNIGYVASLNKGIPLCKGEYIARMDSDDISDPERFAIQLKYMTANQQVGLCGTWLKVVDGSGTPISYIINQTRPEFVKIHLLFSSMAMHPTVLFRANILKENLYNDVMAAEDYDLWTRLADSTQIANIPKYLFGYRWHDGNVSKEKADIQQNNKERIILRQLEKLGITPSDEEFRIHKLSFTLYSFEGKAPAEIADSDDLYLTGLWFKKLLKTNEEAKRYQQAAFRAFLWGRWIVLCMAMRKKSKAFFPPFASYSPKVLALLAQQILLLSKKL